MERRAIAPLYGRPPPLGALLAEEANRGPWRRMGAEIGEFPDGLRVAGRQKLRGVEIETRGDHRMAMAFAVAGLVAEGTTVIRDSACVDVSFPEFFQTLEKVAA